MSRIAPRRTRRVLAATTLALAATAAPAAAAPDFVGNFETGSLSQFRFIGEEQDGPWCTGCGTRPQVQDDVVVEGRRAVRFVLRPDDRRAQLVAEEPIARLGDERWYGASLRFGRDWDWSDHEPETSRNFTILLNLRSNAARGSALSVIVRSDGHLHLSHRTRPGGGEERKDLGAIPYETWMRLVFRVRHSSGGDGLIEVWRDGRRIVSVGGPTWVRGGSPTFKWRVGPYYGDRFTSDRTLWADDSRVGETYDDVR
jgi:hypothetical protein